MKRTYVDAGVLILAARGSGALAGKAISILNDTDRSFVASIFLQLEVIPKAMYHKKQDEVSFYLDFFTSVQQWTESIETVIESAYQIAQRNGLAALDALHVASAIALGSDELITTEKPTKPMYQVSGIKVISLQMVEVQGHTKTGEF